MFKGPRPWDVQEWIDEAVTVTDELLKDEPQLATEVHDLFDAIKVMFCIT